MADRVYVMYCGKIVEHAPLRELFTHPKHPYTQGLLSSVPHLSADSNRFVQIPDNVPSPLKKPHGCYFHTRCSYCTQECTECMPRLTDIGPDRQLRCHHPLGGE